MQIRCAQCRALTQVKIPAAASAPVAIACSGCGRRYRLAVDRPRTTTDQERYRQAKAFAEANTIDLASAYSVLEGVMKLEEALTLLRRSPARPVEGALERPRAAALPKKPGETPAVAAARPVSVVPSAPASGRNTGPTPAIPSGTAPSARPAAVTKRVISEEEATFDPAFADAIRDGCLTVQQAVERGERRSFALRIAQRHRLSMNLALMVADNRITIRRALEQKAENESREPPRPQTSVSQGVWNFMVFSMGALILAGLGVHIYHVWGDYLARNGDAGFETTVASAAERPRIPPAPPPVAPAPPPPLTVPRTDPTGQLIEVSGPDPRSVLIAFCSTGRQAGLRQPVELAPSVPPSSGARLGIFRNLDQPGAPLRAVRIRQDPKTGRWAAGDGRGPITTEVPPIQPPGALTIPVDAQEPRVAAATMPSLPKP